MEIRFYRDEMKCKTILKIEVDDNIQDIEEAKRLIAEDVREQLRKYWKIEEELGIPLEVLFKALKDGFWFKDYGRVFFAKQAGVFNGVSGTYWFSGIDTMIKVKEYGKTWWLEEPKEKASD